MSGRAIAVDIGSRTVKVLALKDGKHGLAVQRFAWCSRAEAGRGLAAAGIPLKGVVAGVAGRDMTLRYTQVPPSPDWQLRNLMELEIQDMAGQTGGELSADYNLVPGIEDEDSGMETVLLAFARNAALERQAEIVRGAKGQIHGYVPNCVALFNAYLRAGPVDDEQTVCLANLGHETIDLAIARGADLLVVRNLSHGGKAFDDAISAAFGFSDRKVEQLKHTLLDLDPASRGRYGSADAEKVTVAAGGAGSTIVSAIQTSMAFCRQQTKNPGLNLDKVLVCGGTSKAKGIRGMLREALRCPVEVFDPFASVDLTGLPPEEYEELDAHRGEAVIALGLAAGQVDASLYQLQILPEAVKRRQRFVRQTVWNIGAGVIAVALLGATAWTGKQVVDEAEDARRDVGRVIQRQRAIHEEANRVAEESARLALIVESLADRAVPLDGTLLTLRALERTMPAEFWITKLELATRTVGDDRPGRRSASGKPVVILEGAGKDVTGSGVDEAYKQFLTDFKAFRYDGVAPTVEQQTSRDEFNNQIFKWTIDFRPAAPAPEETD